MTATNGPEPTLGSWVYASVRGCPSRLLFSRTADGWKDQHGCVRSWSELVDPIDTLEPVTA